MQTKGSDTEHTLVERVLLRIGVASRGGSRCIHLQIVVHQLANVLGGLVEVALLESFAHIVIDEGSPLIELVELVDQAAPGDPDVRVVRDGHAGAIGGRQIAARNIVRRHGANADLKARGRPVDKTERPVPLDVLQRRIDLIGCDITAVEQHTGHVLAMRGIASDHLVAHLETLTR